MKTENKKELKNDLNHIVEDLEEIVENVEEMEKQSGEGQKKGSNRKFGKSKRANCSVRRGKEGRC